MRLCGMTVFAVLLLTGCGDTPPERMKKGVQLYAYYCQECHERSGLVPMLAEIPLSKASLKHHEIVLMIKHGFTQGHSRMPAFPQLTDQQADALAAFVIKQRQQQRYRVQ